MEINLENIKKVLVIKLRYLGDTVLITPVIKNLKEAYPHLELSALVPQNFAEILKYNPYLFEIISFAVNKAKSKKLLVKMKYNMNFIFLLRQKRFDMILDLTNTDRGALFSILSGAKYRLGFNDEGRFRGVCFTKIAPVKFKDLHILDYHLSILKTLGLKNLDKRPEIFLSPEEKKWAKDFLGQKNRVLKSFIAVIHPGASRKVNLWPQAYFAFIADRIKENKGKVVLVSSFTEKELLKIVISHMKHEPDVVNYHLSLRQLASVIKYADIFIGNDSGPMHIASAVGTKIVAFFGPSLPKHWAPYGDNLIFFKNLPCSPCDRINCQDNRCLKEIKPEEVWEKIKWLTK